MQRGSMLVLTAISVLVLSLLATGMLMVGNTELSTTQTYHLNKYSHHAAWRGLEEIRLRIFNTPNNTPTAIEQIQATKSTTLRTSGFRATGVVEYNFNEGLLIADTYITGSLKDWDKPDTELEKIKRFEGFDPPPLKGITLDRKIMNAEPMIWRVPICAQAAYGGAVDNNTLQSITQASYTELLAGVYYVLILY